MEPSTLIIWEDDDTQLYIIPNNKLTPDDIDIITKANGLMVNIINDNEPFAIKLADWLEEKSEFIIEIVEQQLICDNAHITRVCHSGFMM